MIITASDSFTRPSNTTAYADGDLVANSTTAGSVVPMTFTTSALGKGRGTIRRARIFKDAASLTTVSFNVHIFSESPTVNNGDNAAFQPATMANWLGSIPVDVSTNGVASGTDAIAAGGASPEINFDLFHVSSNERRLYGLLEATAAYTPASGEVFTVTIEISAEVL